MECDAEPTSEPSSGTGDPPASVAHVEPLSAVSTSGGDAHEQESNPLRSSVPASAKKAMRRFSSIDISSGGAKGGAKKSQLGMSGLPILEGARQHRSSSLQSSLQHSVSMASTSIHAPAFSRRGRLSMALGNQDAPSSTQPKLAKRSTTFFVAKRGDEPSLGKVDRPIENELVDPSLESMHENSSHT